ncbi:hypothetical protein FQN55_009666 [Onygenales sp. PD_40]|nr:hypothetical protein FQN55_009666 [Onygenales sp. PD_40]KAK2776526.1 hypothetical protein FQN53_002663 [Emmonsiellopsis sp. PD_33]KAK2787657.1 hypothetical protein FQN52_007148 [Onygenales sp. PD_12]KAK2804403.1 hypothetical protein FQN51_002045 [Onygenales sp. PD_10]
MKTSIPADVWETKRALIASLYKDEEWPLKQVIKKIRTDEFNPTETQLRSRLKKWGVTKPSRQKRKKNSDGQTVCPTIRHADRLDLSTASEVSSSSQATPFPDRVAWSDQKAWMLSENIPPRFPKDSSFYEAHHLAAEWGSMNGLQNDGSYAPHVRYSLPTFANSPTLCSMNPYGYKNRAANSINNSALNTSMACQSPFVASETPISASDSYSKSYPGEWTSQTSPIDIESNPLTPWSYVSNDAGQGCQSNMFTLHSASSSVTEYTEPIQSDDCLQPFGQHGPSPNSDLDLLELDPSAKAWKRAGATHIVGPDGVGCRNPRVGRGVHIRRRPEMKSKSDASPTRQQMPKVQNCLSISDNPLSISETDPILQTVSLSSRNDVTHEYHSNQ